MANITTVARPYAKAILQLATHDNSYLEWGEALAFLAALAENPIGRQLLSNRTVSAASKTDFICSLAPDILNEQAKNLLRLLASTKRLLILPELYRLYEEMRKKALGEVVVHLKLAEKLDFNIEKFGENVRVIEDIDKMLIGGGIAKIGNRVIDASIMGRLIAMRENLRQ